MKRFLSLALVVTMPITSFAQSGYSFDEEVNAELQKMSEQAGAVKNNSGVTAAPQVQVNVQASPSQAATQSTTSSAAAQAPVRQEQAAQSSTVVSRQATTVVQATPLTESKAEVLRKSRQDAEIATEQKIVEKLESARLEDEKRRSEVLFGDKVNQLQSGVTVQNSPGATVNTSQGAAQTEQAAVVAPVAAPTPAVQQVQPTIVIVQQPVQPIAQPEVKPVDKVENKVGEGNVAQGIVAAKVVEEIVEERRTYVAGILGVGDYPDVRNVRGNYAVGVAVGQPIQPRWVLEGSFVYSQYQIEQMYGGGYFAGPYGVEYFPRITQMDQYSTGVSTKYTLMTGTFRPFVGGILAYTYRTYRDVQLGYGNNEAQSHAIDLGLSTGLDVQVSRSFGVGFDVRYMWNLYNWANNKGLQKSFARSVYGSENPIESLSYLTFGLAARATF